MMSLPVQDMALFADVGKSHMFATKEHVILVQPLITGLLICTDDRFSLRQGIQQCPGLSQVLGVKTFGEPVVDLGE